MVTTPKCPSCGAKFSHDTVGSRCRACGLPDEVLYAGPQAIARWKRRPTGLVKVGNVEVPGQRLDELSKKGRKRLRTAGRQRARKQHGRSTRAAR